MIVTGWGEVEAGIVADWRAGFTIRECAKRSGWSTDVVSRVLREHGINPRGRPRVHGKAPMWSDAELVAVVFARDQGDARQRYRALFPDSGRTDDAINRRYHEAKQGEASPALRQLREGAA
jgi:hypothetical protein